MYEDIKATCKTGNTNLTQSIPWSPLQRTKMNIIKLNTNLNTKVT
jgi:hypothetical protein